MFLPLKDNIMIKQVFLLTLLSSFAAVSCVSSKQEINKQIENEELVTLAPKSPFDPNTIDGVLATVAGQAILLSDFQAAVLAFSGGQTKVSASGLLIGGTLSPEHAHDILQGLINQKIIQFKSEEVGLTMSDEEVEQRIGEFLKQRGMTQAELEENLKINKISYEDYKTAFQQDHTKQMFIGRVISPQVTVTDDEINSYYLQKTGSVQQVSAVKLRSLMLTIPENENVNTFSTLQTVKNKINKGTDFVELVKNYSMSSDAKETEGLLPPKNLTELPEILREKLTKLKVNDVVGPIVLGNSAFFFQFLGTQMSAGSELEKNYAHWKSELQEIKFNERLMDYLNSERTKLQVNIRPFQIYR